MKKERWSSVSKEATNFVESLLVVEPDKRLTAEKALEHPWILKKHEKAERPIDTDIVDGLRQFGQASKFRRACLEMMAWSLSNEERAKVREYFIALDVGHKGTISLIEMRGMLHEKFDIS